MLTEFKDRTAVVTGAASGIGLGIARRCGERGMNVVLCDVEAGRLAEAAATVGDAARVHTAVVDVSDPQQVQAAADATAERFGPVHLLCNNAGVSMTGRMWNMTVDDVTWLLGVNIVGVFNGVRSFVPGMLEHGQGGHVVNTSSLAGLTPMANASLYSGTKAAVVGMSESLLHDLREREANVGVSVLCPGLVNTNILTSERNRPGELDETRYRAAGEQVTDFYRNVGSDPLEVGDRVLRAVERGDFYILTNEEGRHDIAARSAALECLGPPPAPRPQAILPDEATDRSGGIPGRPAPS
ncbi:MAG TPA: SDR family NAD(P)-dependent oxidoreductase [Acidimicrobiales bacterium]